MNSLILTFLLCYAGAVQTPQAKAIAEQKIVESAPLTPAEAKEGRELLIAQVQKLRQRGELAQKVLDQAGSSPEALLLAYQERDRVLVELNEVETKGKRWAARVQSRTGCLECVLFDFDNLILKKRPAPQTNKQ